MYLIVVAVHACLQWLQNSIIEKFGLQFSLQSYLEVSYCSTSFVRGISTLMGVLCVVVIYLTLTRMYSNLKSSTLTWLTVGVATYPPLFFFFFLAYTDVSSVFFTLLTHYFALLSIPRVVDDSTHPIARFQRKTDSFSRPSYLYTLLACVSGVCCVLMRQTNVVWVGFCAAVAILHQARVHTRQQQQQQVTFKSDVISVIQYLLSYRGFIHTLPYLSIFAAFAVFVKINGGIVIGDKENHIASIHLAQLAYCLLAYAPLLLLQLPKFTNSQFYSIKNVMIFLISSLFCGILIHKYSFAHPFILADNRHFTFYFWRLLQRSIVVVGILSLICGAIFTVLYDSLRTLPVLLFVAYLYI